MSAAGKRQRSPDGKVAIITGSGRGIGKAIAIELASRGASVVLNGRNNKRLSEAEEELKKITPNVLTVCCDISRPEGGHHLIEEALKAFGKIDILVNNVGVSMRGAMADLNPEVFRTVFESNVFSTANVTIPAIRHLRETKGSIVFISSAAGIRGLPFLSAYSSSKMALRAIADTIRIEEKQHGLHVGLVYVGYTENDPDKETIASDGSKLLLKPRSGKGVQTKVSVAEAVIRNIERRQYISTLSAIAKINRIMQSLFPGIVERIIIRNLDKFRESSQ